MHAALKMRRRNPSVSPDLGVERFFHDTGRLIAAPTPKVASRSLSIAFRDLEGGSLDKRHYLPRDLRNTFPDHLIFSFVRNPWARIHSCWKDKIDNAISLGKLRILARFPDLRPFMPFEEFVEWLATPDGSDAVADRHWLSQVRHLDISGESNGICDFIGRLEALDDDVAEISRMSGVNLPPLGRRNQKGSPDWRAAYSDRARRIVAERYAEDIERFGYRFDDGGDMA
mgnify:CR=1 FL=1